MPSQFVVTPDVRDASEREPGVVEVHELQPQTTAIVRATTTQEGIAEAIGPGLEEVFEACGRHGIAIAGMPFVRYLSWGDESELEMGVPVAGTPPREGRVEPGSLPGGRVASVIHLGPYDTLESSYQGITDWVAEHELEAGGPMWEAYHTSPDTHPDPATWRTEILLPLA